MTVAPECSGRRLSAARFGSAAEDSDRYNQSGAIDFLIPVVYNANIWR
jgi:hypothetical protein